MRRILIALALAGLSAGTALGASYDGNWRVTIVTEKGVAGSGSCAGTWTAEKR